MRSEHGKVTARVMDNGVGISQMNREKIFQMFVRASERSETGGIGLYLAKLATRTNLAEKSISCRRMKSILSLLFSFPKNLQSIIDKRKEERNRLEQERMQVGKLRASQPAQPYV